MNDVTEKAYEDSQVHEKDLKFLRIYYKKLSDLDGPPTLGQEVIVLQNMKGHYLEAVYKKNLYNIQDVMPKNRWLRKLLRPERTSKWVKKLTRLECAVVIDFIWGMMHEERMEETRIRRGLN